ncbi:Mov34/MPN/PAD-1 family protein [Luteolibacter algae]|uniref:Mov34/MPN/PAD-1 family protein n=1 Tax=Luteolibacter algae TaxID=454151 RepID=A0ABW5D8W7_9BACT
MTAQGLASLFGEPCSEEGFGSIYSRAFTGFLKGPDVNGTARLLSCHTSDAMETVVLEIDVVLPQHPIADIRSKEVVACRFRTIRDERPEVLALRADFPRLPHQNLQPANSPRSLCLSPTSWDESKHLWSPSAFLEHIRSWLARAASGTLHLRGQPREPLLASPQGYLILPSNATFEEVDKLFVSGDFDSSPMMMWGTRTRPDEQPGKGKFKVIRLEMPPREHGLIETLPDTLADLEILCQSAGYGLTNELAKKVKELAPAGNVARSDFSFQILLALHLPVTGKEHPEITTSEEWVFMIGEALALGEALGVIVSSSGLVGPAIIPQPPSRKRIEDIQVLTIAPFRRLNEQRALASNGLTVRYPSVAVIGVGSLGSKCLEILARQGISKATLIDADRFFPHNTARHVLFGDAVGYKKADALSHLLGMRHDPGADPDDSGFKFITEKFGPNPSEELNSAVNRAGYVLDFSASVAVARELAARDDVSRCFSAFINPGADTLFVHREDARRAVRLDWLEAITLRAIVEDPRLGHAYSRNGSEIWYGGPCREVSTVLPNQNVSIFAAAAAGLFTNHHPSPEAGCSALHLCPETMGLTSVPIHVTTPETVEINGWKVRFDAKLVDSMQAMRLVGLPNETGGVLFGVLDRERKTCSVVMASPSPPDSRSWPDAYIRGSSGLKQQVDHVGELTAGQLQYVGEWHSHPPGHSNRPSQLDREALEILRQIMAREALPAIAFIIGEQNKPHVSVGW